MIHKALHTLLLFLLCLLPLDLWALVQSPDSAYTRADYTTAAKQYEDLIRETEHPTAQMYYNLGCAYYKANDIGRSILNFERAYRILPTDKDIRFNLELARTKAIDKFNARISFVAPLLDRVSHLFSLRTWMVLGFVFFVATMVGLLLYLLSFSLRLRKSGFYLFILTLVLCILSNLFAYRSYRLSYESSEAIVTSSVVTMKSSPDHSGKDIATVHAGLKVRLEQTLNGYSEVVLPDGVVGWLPLESYEKVLTNKMK